MRQGIRILYLLPKKEVDPNSRHAYNLKALQVAVMHKNRCGLWQPSKPVSAGTAHEYDVLMVGADVGPVSAGTAHEYVVLMWV